MIDVQELGVRFTDNYLFKNSSFKINPNEKYALVGSNGSGKSTLLKILAGYQQPDEGIVSIKKGTKIGYLPQDFINVKGKSVFYEVRSSMKEFVELDNQEIHFNKILDSSNSGNLEKEKAIEKLGEIHQKKELLGYYSLDAKIKKVLTGLGFKESDFERLTDEFSGGWIMRIQMAKILATENNLIMLDEPTNHLDMDTLGWVIDFLANSNSSLLIISHDKYFINKITNKTLEIFNGKINYYSGNYNKYLIFKEERDIRLRNEIEIRQKKIKQTTEFIERFRYKSTKAKQVQSRVKQLSKLGSIEIDSEEKEIKISFPEPPRSGIIALKVENLTKYYGKNKIFENLNFEIERGDKVAIVGPNGAGKSTLVKILTGKTDKTSGEISLGHNTFFSYYAQEVAEQLNPDNEIIDELIYNSENLTPYEARTILGSFLFSDDDIFKKISYLSGGEKSRVALASLLTKSSNLIILDEPTNHLDIASKKVLQQALIEFTGTLLIISHDIDFLLPITNKTFEIRNGNLKIFNGDLNYYFSKCEELKISLQEKDSKSNDVSFSNRKELKRKKAELRNEKNRKTKNLKILIENSESKIAEMENEKLNIENKLSNPLLYSNPDEIKNLQIDYNSLKEKLKSEYELWENNQLKLEEIEQYFDSLLPDDENS